MMVKKILIIDDEELVIESLKKLLKKKGYESEIARNGEEAISKVKEGDFNLIISDIRMPEKDGIETVKEIREILKQANKEKIPEILITGYADEERMEEAEKLNVAGTLVMVFLHHLPKLS